MLVLTRERGQEIYIKDGKTGEVITTIQVIDIRGEKVRLGLEGDTRYIYLRDDAKDIEGD